MLGYKVSNFADVKMGFTWCLRKYDENFNSQETSEME